MYDAYPPSPAASNPFDYFTRRAEATTSTDAIRETRLIETATAAELHAHQPSTRAHAHLKDVRLHVLAFIDIAQPAPKTWQHSALELLRRGHWFIPTGRPGNPDPKAPAPASGHNIVSAERLAENWRLAGLPTTTGLATLCGFAGLVADDNDISESEELANNYDAARGVVGPVRVGLWPKRARFFRVGRCGGGHNYGSKGRGVQMLANGEYILVCGRHSEDLDYSWRGADFMPALSDLPVISTIDELAEAIVKACSSVGIAARRVQESDTVEALDPTKVQSADVVRATQRLVADMDAILLRPPKTNRGTDTYNALLRAGALIKACASVSEDAAWLADSAFELTPLRYVHIGPLAAVSPELATLVATADDLLASCPPELRRDFLRGIAMSKGMAQSAAIKRHEDFTARAIAAANSAGLGPEFGQGQLGAQAVPAASADGALDVPPLPDFAECPALAEVAMLAPSYGVDPAVATGVCIGAAGNMLAAKFDVVGVNGGKPLGTNVTVIGFQKSGAGKSTAMDSLLNGAKAVLTAKAATAQSSQALFSARYSAYAIACTKQNAAPLPMNVLKPVRVEGDDFTPQSLQRVLFVNAPAVLISTDEASTMFELATTQDLRVALANTLISVVAGTVKKSTRISDARAMGTSVGKASTAAIETEANATSRVSIVGLTQDDTWRKRILGRGMLEYMETRGVMARMLLVPANTKVRASERMRSTTRPGEGENSPFKLWEETATALAKGIEMHIDRTSLYGKQVGEEQTLAPTAPLASWVTGLPAMPSKFTPPAPAPEDFNSGPTKALGAIDASDAPKVPRGIMLGGDTMRRIVLRISDSDRAAMKERCAVFMEYSERGMLGPHNAALEALVARIPDKIMQVAAALHGLNKADHLITLAWSPFTFDDPELLIPAATLDLAFRFIEHATISAITNGFYGHRVLGKETSAEKRERELHSPTPESERAAAVSAAEAIVLGKLKAAARLPVRDILSKLSKKERRMLPDAESVRVILDNMVAAGRVTVEGNNYRISSKG